MAVTGSGEIKLIGDVNNEINGNTTDTNVSLTTLSTGASKDAPHGLTEFYGYSAVDAPTVTTSSGSSITTSSFTANGNVTATGGENVSKGFYIGTSSSYGSNTKYTVGSNQGTGSFTYNASSLSSGTTYYVTAWASNSAGESVGSTVSTTTTAVIIPATTPIGNPQCSGWINCSDCNGSQWGYAVYVSVSGNGVSNFTVGSYGVCSWGPYTSSGGGYVPQCSAVCCCSWPCSSPVTNYFYISKSGYLTRTYTICSNTRG